MKKKIKNLELDVELAKARKCPPNKKCLAVLSAPKPKQKDPSVNDFDIRTHKDFHKYVEARKVKSCSSESSHDSCSKSESKASGYKAELERCQSQFLEAFGTFRKFQ